MGRTQVSHSARPQVHSAAPATSKIAANTKLQQQQQHRSSSSAKPKSYPNAQVYRPTPVAEHPDDAFMTGAWMFDQSRVPQWMQSQLPSTSKTNMSKSAAIQKRSNTTTATPAAVSPKQMQQPVKQMQSKPMTQSKPNMAAKSMQQQKQSTLPPMRYATTKAQPIKSLLQEEHKLWMSTHKVIRATPIHEHPDTAFLSGAWLFDTSRTPLWMQREVPSVASALVMRSRRLAKALPIARTQRAAASRSYNIVVPMRKAFGAVPHAVIPVGSVKARNAHPDDAFFSGAWMFDAKCAPSWLMHELKGKQQQQQVHVQKQQKTSHTQIAGVKLTSGRKLGV